MSIDPRSIPEFRTERKDPEMQEVPVAPRDDSEMLRPLLKYGTNQVVRYQGRYYRPIKSKQNVKRNKGKEGAEQLSWSYEPIETSSIPKGERVIDGDVLLDRTTGPKASEDVKKGIETALEFGSHFAGLKGAFVPLKAVGGTAQAVFAQPATGPLGQMTGVGKLATGAQSNMGPTAEGHTQSMPYGKTEKKREAIYDPYFKREVFKETLLDEDGNVVEEIVVDSRGRKVKKGVDGGYRIVDDSQSPRTAAELREIRRRSDLIR